MSDTRIHVGTDFYNETTEPTIKDDGTLVLANGRAFPPGSWTIGDDDSRKR